GTGKTTSARIFASMINKGSGEPIELDAASNNSVEDIRRITEEAQTKSLDSEYKVFIVDECHMLSNSAWNAFLKTLEEPPTKSIFILCTTNPEKIPATILSRVQRYNFQRISMQGVIDRLLYILEREDSETDVPGLDWDIHAIDLIAKIADGGMRDAITLLDKCLSYNNDLTVPNVINALGLVSYDTMFKLTAFLINKDTSGTIKLITSVFESGMDLKQFIKDYFEFILDLNIYYQTGDMDSIKIPIHCEPTIQEFKNDWGVINSLLQVIVDLMNEIKWIQNPKSVILARLMLFNGRD
ncbi:MAG: DNA polymerase III subunit gamma/tau, partial [Clostridia bacterium]